MIGDIKISIVVIFHGAEHVLFADEIIFIPQKEGGRGGKASALHRYVTVNVILMRSNLGVEKIDQYFWFLTLDYL